MASRDPDIASAAASVAAHSALARLDGEQRRRRTAPARTKVWEQYLHRADPDGVMSEEDREVAAQHLRSADMARLQLASAQAKAAKRARVAA